MPLRCLTTGRLVATPRRRRGQSMSVLGTKRTCRVCCTMSALGKAENIVLALSFSGAGWPAVQDDRDQDAAAGA